MRPIELDILFYDGQLCTDQELDIADYDLKKALFFKIDMIAPYMIGETECTTIISGTMSCISPYPYYDVMQYIIKWM